MKLPIADTAINAEPMYGARTMRRRGLEAFTDAAYDTFLADAPISAAELHRRLLGESVYFGGFYASSNGGTVLRVIVVTDKRYLHPALRALYEPGSALVLRMDHRKIQGNSTVTLTALWAREVKVRNFCVGINLYWYMPGLNISATNPLGFGEPALNPRSPLRLRRLPEQRTITRGDHVDTNNNSAVGIEYTRHAGPLSVKYQWTPPLRYAGADSISRFCSEARSVMLKEVPLRQAADADEWYSRHIAKPVFRSVKKAALHQGYVQACTADDANTYLSPEEADKVLGAMVLKGIM